MDKDNGKKKILVVDDESDIITLMRLTLERHNYHIIAAFDGVEAVEKAFAEEPDLIILDVMMPKMNGYQVCRLLKYDERTCQIPIILCTVKSLKGDRTYGLTIADFYITKPFDSQNLLKIVDKALKKKDSIKVEKEVKGISVKQSSTINILSKVNELLDKKLQELTILQSITGTMTSTLNLDEVLRTILHGITGELGFDKVMLCLVNEQNMIEGKMSIGHEKNIDKIGCPVDSPNILCRVIKTGKAYTMNDIQKDEDIPPMFRGKNKSRVTAFIPIIAKGNTIGVITVDSEKSREIITNEEMDFLMTLANQAGLAIENANLYEETLRLSITDGLTGLFNHRYFYERLETEITRARRYQRKLSLFMLDIDNFKIYNDQCGHLLGDYALKNIANILRANTRDVDVVARYGGEEFSVILPETNIQDAEVYAERVRAEVEKHHFEKEEYLPDKRLTISIGVAIIEKGMDKVESLIRNADEALYQAKSLGRNKVCVYRKKA